MFDLVLDMKLIIKWVNNIIKLKLRIELMFSKRTKTKS
jgi:hypothetical protein